MAEADRDPNTDTGYHQDDRHESVTRDVGGPGIAGSPGVSEGGVTDPEATRAEEKEAIEKAHDEPHGLRGDLGDSAPGED